MYPSLSLRKSPPILSRKSPLLDAEEIDGARYKSGFTPPVVASLGALFGQAFLIFGASTNLKDIPNLLFDDGRFTGPGWAVFTLMVFGIIAGFIGLMANNKKTIPALIAFGPNLVLFLAYMLFFMA